MPNMHNRLVVYHSEFSTKVSTKYLSHFTPEFETILKIVETGFKPSLCDEYKIYESDYSETEALNNWYQSLDGGDPKGEDFEHKVPMVCFCDIPHRIAANHRKVYGKYCIAMKKSWAVDKGLSPIIYIPQDSKTHRILNHITILKKRLQLINEECDIPQIVQISQELDQLFEFIKPYNSKIPGIKFYNEREWRYTPTIFRDFNPQDATQYLKFGKEDFDFLIVQSVKEKNILLKALREKFGYVSSKRIKIKKQ